MWVIKWVWTVHSKQMKSSNMTENFKSEVVLPSTVVNKNAPDRGFMWREEESKKVPEKHPEKKLTSSKCKICCFYYYFPFMVRACCCFWQYRVKMSIVFHKVTYLGLELFNQTATVFHRSQQVQDGRRWNLAQRFTVLCSSWTQSTKAVLIINITEFEGNMSENFPCFCATVRSLRFIWIAWNNRKHLRIRIPTLQSNDLFFFLFMCVRTHFWLWAETSRKI